MGMISTDEYRKHLLGYNVIDCQVRRNDFYYLVARENYTQRSTWKDNGEPLDETALKKRVIPRRAGQPRRGGSTDVVKLDIPLSAKEATNINSVLSKVPQGQGLPTPGYEYSFPKVPTPGQCNCATFPFEGMGIPAPEGLPVQGGIKQFVGDLEALGATPWNPLP
jgi:hypothetical protein